MGSSGAEELAVQIEAVAALTTRVRAMEAGDGETLCCSFLWFRVWGLGFRVQGLGFSVYGFRVWGGGGGEGLGMFRVVLGFVVYRA